MMSRARAEKENMPSLGRVLGWGTANDATHITAPARNGRGLIQAIQEAFRMAGMQAEEISAVSAHGTGTVYNDAMEITAFREVFGKRNLPVFSVKGAIGHILGAAGGIEAVLGLKALSDRTAPPTVGLSAPMEGAKGMVSGRPVNFSGNRLLTTNSGFGGVNAALVLESE
jgi:3-oxoacyl-[acyl-carrier-protein] synthase II